MGKVVIIGGSGVDDSPQFEGADWRFIDTRFENGLGGTGEVEYKERDGVIFIPRHGRVETVRYGPSRTQYGANLIAARELGGPGTIVVGVSAVGSLRSEIAVKSLVVPDDVWDQSGRQENLYGAGLVIHPSKRPPFSEAVRRVLIEVGRGYLDESKPHFAGVHERGTYVTIPGDSFGSRTEGETRASRADVVGMTLHPEYVMAIQLDMRYACAALPVDMDFDASHAQTLQSMRDLSEVVPAFITEVVERLKPLVATDVRLEQLVGNVIPPSEKGWGRVTNPYLQGFGRELVAKYC